MVTVKVTLLFGVVAIIERRGDGLRLRSGSRIAAAAFDLEDDFAIDELLSVERRGERSVDVVVGAFDDGAFRLDSLARAILRRWRHLVALDGRQQRWWRR